MERSIPLYAIISGSGQAYLFVMQIKYLASWEFPSIGLRGHSLTKYKGLDELIAEEDRY